MGTSDLDGNPVEGVGVAWLTTLPMNTGLHTGSTTSVFYGGGKS